MDAHEILQALQRANTEPEVYAAFERETGLTPAQIQMHFREWDNLPHEEALRISEKHGLDVNVGGFAAYLADQNLELPQRA